MTNNHCPDRPARAFQSRANEVAIADFSEKLLDMISSFSEDFSMGNRIRIDPSIFDTWTECTRCESLICDTHEGEVTKTIQEIMAFLNANLIA